MPARLTSRKFWLAVATAIYFAAQGEAESVRAVVLGYLLAQGGVDAAARATGNG